MRAQVGLNISTKENTIHNLIHSTHHQERIALPLWICLAAYRVSYIIYIIYIYRRDRIVRLLVVGCIEFIFKEKKRKTIRKTYKKSRHGRRNAIFMYIHEIRCGNPERNFIFRSHFFRCSALSSCVPGGIRKWSSRLEENGKIIFNWICFYRCFLYRFVICVFCQRNPKPQFSMKEMNALEVENIKKKYDYQVLYSKPGANGICIKCTFLISRCKIGFKHQTCSFKMI